jgi:hypothetical protein
MLWKPSPSVRFTSALTIAELGLVEFEQPFRAPGVGEVGAGAQLAHPRSRRFARRSRNAGGWPHRWPKSRLGSATSRCRSRAPGKISPGESASPGQQEGLRREHRPDTGSGAPVGRLPGAGGRDHPRPPLRLDRRATASSRRATRRRARTTRGSHGRAGCWTDWFRTVAGSLP